MRFDILTLLQQLTWMKNITSEIVQRCYIKRKKYWYIKESQALNIWFD